MNREQIRRGMVWILEDETPSYLDASGEIRTRALAESACEALDLWDGEYVPEWVHVLAIEAADEFLEMVQVDEDEWQAEAQAVIRGMAIA